MLQAPMNIMSFYEQDMEYADPGSVYDMWLRFNDSIKGIDPALDNWFYLVKATQDEAEYLDIYDNKELVISGVLRKVKHGGITSRDSIKGARFRAWSRKISAKGPSNDSEEALVAYSTLAGGTNRKPALFHLEVGALRDARGEEEMAGFTKICAAISNVKIPIWLSVAPDSYIDHAIFPHRCHVGWMAVVPDVNIQGELPFLAYDEYLPDVGTLIVTTQDRFDSRNPTHIEASQATEIALNKLGLLPEAL